MTIISTVTNLQSTAMEHSKWLNRILKGRQKRGHVMGVATITPMHQHINPTEIDAPSLSSLSPLSLFMLSLSCSLPKPSATNQTRERGSEKSAIAMAAISLSHPWSPKSFEEMEAEQGEAVTAFELALVVPKRDAPPHAGGGDGDNSACDCVEFLVRQLRDAGLAVERVQGLSEEFLKVVLSFSRLFVL